MRLGRRFGLGLLVRQDAAAMTASDCCLDGHWRLLYPVDDVD